MILTHNLILKIPIYVSGRYEKYFPNPLEFKPERFLKDPDNLENKYNNLTD